MGAGDIEQRARAFAESAHGDQPYGDQPYVTHLAAVRTVLREFGFDGDLGVAAWLHDVVEDTDVPIEQVAAEFGPAVAALVWAVTGEGATRADQVRSAYAKIEQCPRAAILKLADRTANVEACVRTATYDKLERYRAEHPGFSARLRVLHTDPVVAGMWDRLDAAIGSQAIGGHQDWR